MLLRTLMRALVVLAAATAPAVAAPLINLSLVGRHLGSGTGFTRAIDPPYSGSRIEYQLIADIAPIGTTRGSLTINSLTKSQAPTGDGVNNLKIDLVAITDVGTPSVLVFETGTLNADPDPILSGDSWATGTGASGGTPSTNSLLGIRPAHATGLQSAIDREIVMTGVFTVGSSNWMLSGVAIRWAAGGAGSGKINGGTNMIISTSTEASNDPFIGYSPLSFVPEPTSASLVLISVLGMCTRRPRVGGNTREFGHPIGRA